MAALQTKFKAKERIFFKPTRQHHTRPGYVQSARKDGGYHLRIIQNNTIIDVPKVSSVDARKMMRVVQEGTTEFQAHAEAGDWRLLDRDCEQGGSKPGAKKKRASEQPCVVPYVALHEALRKERVGAKAEARLRLGTFNVCHLGGGGCIHPREKIMNLAAVIRGSLADVVVLQEVTTGASETVALLAMEIGGNAWDCRLSDASGGSGPAKGECYALVWNKARVEAVLGAGVGGAGGRGGADQVQVENFMYARRDTGHALFRSEAEWGTTQRADFSFGGASAARLPGFFRLHHERSGRSLVVATVHTAFSDAETRRRQFGALKSLLPSRPLDCSQCLFALLGDFNSDASNTKGLSASVSFAETKQGMALAEELKQRCNIMNVSQHGDATSVGGLHYDEAFVQTDAVGRRHAHVFPTQGRLGQLATSAVKRRANRSSGDGGGGMAAARAGDCELRDVFTPPDLRPEEGSIHPATFNSRVFTDHLLVWVDVEFRAPQLPTKGRELYAKAVARQEDGRRNRSRPRDSAAAEEAPGAAEGAGAKPTRKCGKCGKAGHNARTCKAGEEEAGAKSARKCGVCGKAGHNKRTCPDA